MDRHSLTKRAKLALLVAAPAIAMAGCQGGDRADVGQASAEIPGFAEPVQVALPFNADSDSPVGTATIGGVRAPCIAVRMVEAGSLKFAPDASKAPWWTLSAKRGQVSDREITVALGSRKAVSQTIGRQWQEAGRDHQAVTVTYEIGGPRVFGGAYASKHGPFTLEMVQVKDAASGAWRAAADTHPAIDREAELRAILSPLAEGCETAPLERARNAARRNAFNAIEKDLRGRLRRSRNDARVLISDEQRRAYYAKPARWRTMTVQMAQDYCARVTAERRRGWRVPTPSEIEAATADGRFIDTPDGRLWGYMTKGADGVSRSIFVTSAATGAVRVLELEHEGSRAGQVTASSRAAPGGRLSLGPRENARLVCVTNL